MTFKAYNSGPIWLKFSGNVHTNITPSDESFLAEEEREVEDGANLDKRHHHHGKHGKRAEEDAREFIDESKWLAKKIYSLYTIKLIFSETALYWSPDLGWDGDWLRL